MRCPFCSQSETKVIDSRFVADGNQVRRRRECQDCQERFTTYEIAELTLPRIVKRNGERVSFSEDNLRAGILRALEKRSVSMEQVEELLSRIKHRLRTLGEREASTSLIGDWVMRELKELDEVAYVRFASVYNRFENIQAFREEIDRLETPETMPESTQDTMQEA